MASFTMTLAEALATRGGTFELVNGETVVTKPEVIGLGHYPIFSEDYRPRLTGLIFDRYMNCEIGLETVSLFAQAVRRRMNEEMPYLNKLYESARLEFDPLSTVKLTTIGSATNEQQGTSDARSTNETESETGTRVVNQEFPQHALKGNADYASNAADTRAFTDGVGASSDTANTSSTGRNETTSETSGYQGSAADLISKYRQSLINVDTMVLDMLADCFMLIWEAPTTYTERSNYYGYYA